jgi:hypothetical protein
VRIGINALWQRLDCLGLSFKKTLHASGRNRPGVQDARRKWRIRQPDWQVERLVFIDETGLNTKMTRLYGRARKSERCIAPAPFGHWHSNTFIAALRVDGLHAPRLLNGAMNGESFLTHVTEVLGPTLRNADIVLCDNLSSHKVSGVAEAIKEAGCPDLLPAALQS